MVDYKKLFETVESLLSVESRLEKELKEGNGITKEIGRLNQDRIVIASRIPDELSAQDIVEYTKAIIEKYSKEILDKEEEIKLCRGNISEIAERLKPYREIFEIVDKLEKDEYL